ncbi:MAG TPA: FGGY-family carbohydrate kinase [Acidimicrobiales bacterium]|nr:FGGY-family carbohydrate kinase [Acidimicrobiales bacterium]
MTGGAGEVTTVVAVDFGAASIRVCRVDLPSARLEVVHRHAHQPTPDGRWDWDRLVDEMIRGLQLARAAGPVASIGIDTWGVDYGLLDADGRLVAPPFSYRHPRTDGYRTIVDRLGEVALYRTTGVQLQPFNTLFQLAVHDRAELARARHVVLLPELLAHHLTGEVHAERTSAGTTALVDLATGDWSPALLEAIGVDPMLLAPIEPAGTRVGTWEGVPVHLVGGHDTASAVAALDLGPRAAFVSAGTWMLVGREQPAPELAEWARLANFTNEAGALGGIRFLKNLAGSWLIEGCRPAWGDPPIDDLLAAAAAVEHDGTIVDVTDTRFLHPDDMLGEVTRAAGLPRSTPPPVVVRTIVESMVDATARVLLSSLSRPYPAQRRQNVEVIGGGARSALYRRRLAEQTGLPVAAGPVEATALGNALVQGMALGLTPERTATR